jgi:hypothetical protein
MKLRWLLELPPVTAGRLAFPCLPAVVAEEGAVAELELVRREASATLIAFHIRLAV